MNKISSLPKGEFIVSMLVHDNEVIVATNKHVYMMNKDNVMRKVIFKQGLKKDRCRVCSRCNGSGMIESGKVSMSCKICNETGLIK